MCKSTEKTAQHQTEELTVEKEKEAIEHVTNLIPVRPKISHTIFFNSENACVNTVYFLSFNFYMYRMIEIYTRIVHP